MVAARGMVQLVGTQLITAMPTSKTARETARGSGLTVVVPVVTTLVGTLALTPTTDSAETTAQTAAGAGHLAPRPATPTQTACVKEAAGLLVEMLLLLVTGTATSPFANQERFLTLTTTNLSA